jgi:ribosomal-protein-alanine N-acetyltransferase
MTEIGLMELRDVEQVLEIENQSFAVPWSREAFEREVSENLCARYLVARENGAAVAYAGMWLVLDEAHITNIAVRKDLRGRGIGEKVTRALMQLAADTGVRYMTLEVRRSNLAAQSLYRKLGFLNVGFRKRYYEDNGEDALIMACENLPEPNPENDPYLISE